MKRRKRGQARSQADPSAPCPCALGRGETIAYLDCCGRAHRGEEPASAEALMRSRYSAFVLGEAAYLYETLHPDHPDRAKRDRKAFLRSVEKSQAGRVFRELVILEVPPVAEDGSAQVLFWVESVQRGEDLSFLELSTFLPIEGGAFRYFCGELLPRELLPGDPKRYDIASFEALL